jgi:hypothetical protein
MGVGKIFFSRKQISDADAVQKCQTCPWNTKDISGETANLGMRCEFSTADRPIFRGPKFDIGIPQLTTSF